MNRWSLALGMVVFAVPNVLPCVFPPDFPQSPTFRQETREKGARIIVSGTIANPRGEGKAALTDFYIETTLRSDPAMKGKTSLVVNRHLPIEKKNYPPRYVLFCDAEKGKIDPYRGVVVQRVASVEYVKKAIALDSTDPVRNLLFFFRYLDDPDPEVAKDAFHELTLAEDTDIGAAGRNLDAKKLRKWLDDPKTPMARVGLYAKLLAAAGTPEDAARLAAILKDPLREAGTGLDSVLVAYVMLAPKKGWDCTLSILGNPGEDFMRRYMALKAVRSVLASRTGVVTNREIDCAYRVLLAQEDIVDLAIEDFRRAERWDLAPAILSLVGTNAHELPIVRRALLRYALACKGSVAATAYVAGRRKADKEAVEDAQESLDREATELKKFAGSEKK